jgi:hypothetical protein
MPADLKRVLESVPPEATTACEIAGKAMDFINEAIKVDKPTIATHIELANRLSEATDATPFLSLEAARQLDAADPGTVSKCQTALHGAGLLGCTTEDKQARVALWTKVAKLRKDAVEDRNNAAATETAKLAQVVAAGQARAEKPELVYDERMREQIREMECIKKDLMGQLCRIAGAGGVDEPSFFHTYLQLCPADEADKLKYLGLYIANGCKHTEHFNALVSENEQDKRNAYKYRDTGALLMSSKQEHPEAKRFANACLEAAEENRKILEGHMLEVAGGSNTPHPFLTARANKVGEFATLAKRQVARTPAFAEQVQALARNLDEISGGAEFGRKEPPQPTTWKIPVYDSNSQQHLEFDLTVLAEYLINSRTKQETMSRDIRQIKAMVEEAIGSSFRKNRNPRGGGTGDTVPRAAHDKAVRDNKALRQIIKDAGLPPPGF